MKLHLLRHGMTIANERRLYCGWSDPGLTEVGREQLLRLKECCDYPDVANCEIISSGMRRTDETLQLIYGRAADRTIPDLREMHFGSFEMRSYAELKDDACYQAWIMDESGTVCTPGGESSAGFQGRVCAAADALSQDAIVFCHGGVISAIMQHFFPEEGKDLYGWQPSYGCGYTVVLEGTHREYFPLPERRE